MKVTPEKLKEMLNSQQVERIFRHTNECQYCQALQSCLGMLIEKHMEEIEKKEELV